MKNRDAIYGAMYGVAVGDALGAPVEMMWAHEIKSKHGIVRDMLGGGWLNLEKGEVTDDTLMTLCVAHGIIENPESPYVGIGKSFISWYNSKPKDVGRTCAMSISRAMKTKNASLAAWLEASRQTHIALSGKSAGNGSLMRTVYIGAFYNELGFIENCACNVSYMTHFDTVAAYACALYSRIIYRLTHTRNDTAKERIEIIESELNSFVHDDYRFDTMRFYKPLPKAYVVDSFRTALHAIVSTETFEDALIDAVNRGGDADTIGAIAGGIAGALYGFDAIPQRWTDALFPRIRNLLDAYSEKAYEHNL